MVKELVLSQKRHGLHEALLAAATRTIAERGYQALRARDLANEAGCAVGAIYNVFPDLDALTLAVKSRTLDELQADILEQLGPDETTTRAEGEARLMASARIYLDYAHRNRRLWLSAFEHTSPDTPSLRAYMLRLDNIFANVERPLTAILPNMPPQRRKMLARAMFSAVHGMVSLGLVEKLGDFSLEDLHWQVRVVLAAMLQGLRDEPLEPANAREPSDNHTPAS
jgi:AcrR family transcriptional regulator